MLLVTLCDSCLRVALVAAAEAAAGQADCQACGRASRVIPSCGYRLTDRALFTDLSSVIAEGSLSPLEAGRLCIGIERALSSHAYTPFFELLSTRLPGFTPIQLLMTRNHVAQRRALHMLRSIFEALSTTRRSGIMRASGPDQGTLHVKQSG